MSSLGVPTRFKLSIYIITIANPDVFFLIKKCMGKSHYSQIIFLGGIHKDNYTTFDEVASTYIKIFVV